MRCRKPRGRGVDDQGHLAGRLVEALLEPQPQVLEVVERALGALGVVGLMTSREAQRVGLDPGHRPSLRGVPAYTGRVLRHLGALSATNDRWLAAQVARVHARPFLLRVVPTGTGSGSSGCLPGLTAP